MKRLHGLVVVAVLGGLMSLPLATARPAAAVVATGDGETWRVSLSTTGGDPNKASSRARISHDGNHSCFQTNASNLAGADVGDPDVYWVDFTNPSAPVTRRVSTSNTGGNADDESTFCEISGNGRYVTFSSLANNLVTGASGGVFVRDMFDLNPATATRHVEAEADRPVISDDASLIAYNKLGIRNDIYVEERVGGRQLQVTDNPNPGSVDESLRPEISGDGNFLIFATDLQLVPAQDTNSERDVYLADLRPWRGGAATIPTPRLVSVGRDGLAAGTSSSRPGINANGSVVSFQSADGNLVAGDTNGRMDAFVRDYRTNAAGATFIVSYNRDGVIPMAEGERPQLDDSGDIVGFVSSSARIVQGDTNERQDAFVRNWKLEQRDGFGTHIQMLAVSPTGDPGVCPGIPDTSEETRQISTRPYLSGDGTKVVFVTGDCNLANDAAHGGPDANFFSDIYIRGPRRGPLPTPLNGFGQFTPLANPTRILDTRAAVGWPSTQPLAGGAPVAIDVAGRGGVPTHAGLVALNVTVTEPTASAFLTVFPSDGTMPTVSNLNFVPGQTVPNLVVVRLGVDGKVKIFTNAGTAHVLFDVVGWFGSRQTMTPGARLVSQTPSRKLDTRDPALSQGYTKVGAGQTIDIAVVPPGTNVTGVVLNLTGTEPTRSTFVTAFPANQSLPLASSLNLTPGLTRPNLVMVGVSPQGRVKLYNLDGAVHLVVDLVGTFTRTGSAQVDNVPTGRVIPLDLPVRMIDTRLAGGKLAGPGTRLHTVPAFPVSVAGDMAGVVMNVTATEATSPTYLTVFPPDAPQPLASNLNVLPGQNVPNLAVSRLTAADQLAVFNQSGAVHYIADVTAVVLA
jgi:hypothetical protein